MLDVNGYYLIGLTDPDVENRGNGLNIVGRGGEHQFDALGQFKWSLPFIYPIRLFVEAKFRNRKTGIDVIRAEVGILVDLNHNYSTVRLEGMELYLPRYDYHSLVVSASGFSQNAIRMAIAHKIQLLDLSSPQYYNLLDSINSLIDQIWNRNGTISDGNAIRIRSSFRNILGLGSQGYYIDDFNDKLMEIRDETSRLGGIFLASTNTSLVVPLVPENYNNFIESLRNNPNQKVSIIWYDENSEWEIIPKDESYKLKFALPEEMAKYVFGTTGADPRDQALNAKMNYISHLSFIADLGREREMPQPILCTLSYDDDLTEQLIGDFE